MRETQVQPLGWEDPLEKEMATHSSTLAWKNPMDGGAWQATVHGISKSQAQLSDFTFTFQQCSYYQKAVSFSQFPISIKISLDQTPRVTVYECSLSSSQYPSLPQYTASIKLGKLFLLSISFRQRFHLYFNLL